MTAETARALIYTNPGRAEISEVPLDPLLDDQVEVRTIATALSRGTERLVFHGLVPVSEHERMKAPFQAGKFSFPIKYGYCAVGTISDGPSNLLGRNVFCLHPHQSHFRVPIEMVNLLPESLDPARAVLAANAETAVNAIWDAKLKPGSQVLVVGAGLVGCLIAAFLSLRGDLRVTCCDILPHRAATLSEFDVSFVTQPEGSVYQTAFHCSASAAGLQTAIDALSFEGEVIELSWFGDKPVPLILGGAFHSQRLAIRSSQVGHVAASRRASTGYRERMAEALRLLGDPRLDAFVTEEIAFEAVPDALPRLLGDDPSCIATRIVY